MRKRLWFWWRCWEWRDWSRWAPRTCGAGGLAACKGMVRGPAGTAAWDRAGCTRGWDRAGCTDMATTATAPGSGIGDLAAQGRGTEACRDVRREVVPRVQVGRGGAGRLRTAFLYGFADRKRQPVRSPGQRVRREGHRRLSGRKVSRNSGGRPRDTGREPGWGPGSLFRESVPVHPLCVDRANENSC